jgi:hypothetical protein
MLHFSPLNFKHTQHILNLWSQHSGYCRCCTAKKASLCQEFSLHFPCSSPYLTSKHKCKIADLQLLSRSHIWRQYFLTQDTACLKIMAVFLQTLPFSFCKECKMSYIFSSVNSLNNGVKTDLTKWFEFVSSKHRGHKILCALTALQPYQAQWCHKASLGSIGLRKFHKLHVDFCNTTSLILAYHVPS